jgi:hypothetical protein
LRVTSAWIKDERSIMSRVNFALTVPASDSVLLVAHNQTPTGALWTTVLSSCTQMAYNCVAVRRYAAESSFLFFTSETLSMRIMDSDTTKRL